MHKNQYMKKKIHTPLYLKEYECISCHEKYQNYSTSKENKKISICANCNLAYKGESSAKMIIGKVEKFHQRQQKSQEKNKE